MKPMKSKCTAILPRSIATLALLLASRETFSVAPGSATSPPGPVRQLSLASKPRTGDLDLMVQRKMIRIVVPYSRTLYFNDKGRERGITADAAREFEQYLNQKFKTAKRPITVYLIPTTRDKLLQQVVDGHADIAAGNLTVTPERLQIVDFAVQRGHVVNEIVVTGAKAPTLGSVEALGGMTIHVRRSSSYFDSLTELNERSRIAGKPETKLRLVPDALEDEDMMEMANAGLIDVMVVDDWKARIWAQVLPKVTVHDQIVVREGAHSGWAIRKGSPQLQAAIEDFYVNSANKRASYESRISQAMRRVKQIKDPTGSGDWKRFEEMQALFQRYGARYNFDPLMLAAQGYQESALDQSAHSSVGAIGVMQLMPATGAEMKVGDIHVVEANIHAGTKYMDMLMSKYFPDAHFSEAVRPLFAFASYNAGPGNIARMRREAAKRQLDPDKWFNNVEIVVAEKIGAETTTYVRNIYKYYVTYKMITEAQDAQRKARESLTPGTDS